MNYDKFLSNIPHTEEFKESFEKLPDYLKKQTEEALEKFYTSPERKGLNIEKIYGDDELYSMRVSRAYRIIFRKDSKGEPEFLYVGNHDDAYDGFVEGYREKLKTHDNPAAFRRSAGEKNIETESVEKLTQETIEKDLPVYIKLPEENSHLVNEDFNKNMIIRGVSGSGKTCILVYRALKFVRSNPEKEVRVLFITFNKSLKNYLNKFFDYVCNTREQRDSIIVENIDKWIYDTFKLKPGNFEEELKNKLKSYSYEPEKLPLKLLRSEIKQNIIGCMNLTFEEYLKTNGVYRNLSLEEKEFIFRLFEDLKMDYVDRAIKTGDLEYTWFNYLTVFELLRRRKLEIPLFDHIFVDETQDMYPIQIMILKEFLKEGASMTLAGSETQSIYNTNFRWDHIKNILDAEEHVLLTCFRNADKIGDLVNQILRKMRNFEREEVLTPKYRVASEFEPVVMGFESIDREFEFIVEEIKKLDISLHHVAVLLPGGNLVTRFSELAKEEGIEPIESSDKPYEHGKLNVLTYHKSKGLEFETVFVAGASKEDLDTLSEAAYGERQEMMLRLLHVAMSRALKRLYITWHEEKSDFLDFV